MQADAVITAEVIHGIIAFACVIGGVFALFKGHNVYQDGRAKILIEMVGLKITAQSIGAVVMATAFGWAALGVRVVPDIKTSPQQTQVYSFVTGRGSVDAPVVYAAVNLSKQKLPGPYGPVLAPTHGLNLADAFAQGAASQNAATPAIGGNPAHVTNVHPVTVDGETFLLATLESENAAAVVQYDSTLLPNKTGGAQLVFKPLGASVVGPSVTSRGIAGPNKHVLIPHF